MIKGSEIGKTDLPIEPLLLDRWSPRAMSGEEIAEEELMRLFEAARWAPSSFNAQQWRALYARRGTEHWPVFFDLLVEANKSWAKNAAVLVVFVSRRTFDHDGEPSRTHSYDTGAAWENFALQGCRQDLIVHGMEGFDYERARAELRIPDDFHVEAMAAVGKPGVKEVLPEKLQKRESPMTGANCPKVSAKDRFDFEAWIPQKETKWFLLQARVLAESQFSFLALFAFFP